jgi:hypothetical protein
MLLLSPDDRETALALDGAAPFDPMGNGTKRSDKIQMPDSIMDEPDELRSWVKRAFDYAATLPRKVKGATTKPTAGKPAATRPAARKPAATKPAARKTAATKHAATKPAARKRRATT